MWSSDHCLGTEPGVSPDIARCHWKSKTKRLGWMSEQEKIQKSSKETAETYQHSWVCPLQNEVKMKGDTLQIKWEITKVTQTTY